MRKNWKLSAIAAALGLALAVNVFGQAAAMNGEIAGTVTDPSGAAIRAARGGGRRWRSSSALAAVQKLDLLIQRHLPDQQIRALIRRQAFVRPRTRNRRRSAASALPLRRSREAKRQ